MNLKSKLADAMGLGGFLHIGTQLEARHFVPDEKGEHFRLKEDGTMGRFREEKKDRRREINRVVTAAYVEFLVDQHQTESSAIGDFKYHEMGLGIQADAGQPKIQHRQQ